jgi:hypothetical protein
VIVGRISAPVSAHNDEQKDIDEERATHRSAATSLSKSVNIQNRVIVSSSPLLDVKDMNSKPRGSKWAAELAIGPTTKALAEELCGLLKTVKGLQPRAFMALHIGLVLSGHTTFAVSSSWQRYLFLNDDGILSKQF